MRQKDYQALIQQALHLREVEGLSLRQIASKTGVSRTMLQRLFQNDQHKPLKTEGIIVPYGGLISQWYSEYPFLQATQVLQRLRQYGYEGGYTTVKEFTLEFRKKRKKTAYHEITTLPGQEAQVDWMQWTFPWGISYGFVYVLSFCRYVYVKFYPGCSMEFFLDGHISAFQEIRGVPAEHLYDNLKSVVVKRTPEITYNPQFMDFARHYRFSIRACNVRRANEKGKVERANRVLEDFLRVNTFKDINELNGKVLQWRYDKNNREHRSTHDKPSEALNKETLKALPQIPYKPYRYETAAISSTGFVQIQSNRYSVPTSYCNMTAELFIYPQSIEITVNGKPVASHKRQFGRNEKIEHPSHRERLLAKSPNFKLQRIHQLMKNMDKTVQTFINEAQKDAQEPYTVSYELFKLLKGISKETLISAVKEAVQLKSYRVSYIRGLLGRTERQDNPVSPQKAELLDIDYNLRGLNEYDALL